MDDQEGLGIIGDWATEHIPLPTAGEPERLTVQGWLGRLEIACFEFVRTGETAEGWEKVQAVEQQVLEFLQPRDQVIRLARRYLSSRLSRDLQALAQALEELRA